MIAFINNILSYVAWWVKLIILIVFSFLSTLLPLPINLTDLAFVGTVGHFTNVSWVILVVLLTTALDTVFGVLTYYWANKLTGVIIKSDKKKEQLEKMRIKLKDNKWAGLTIFIAMITPLPFTLTIYAASVVEYNIKKLAPILLIGRFIKYATYGLLFYYGIKLFS